MRSFLRGSVLTSIVLSMMPGFLASNQGLARTTDGTVARIDKARIDVKDATGTTVTFVVTAKTVFQRGDKAIQPSEVKIGERVAVLFDTSGSARTALNVRVGVPEAKAVYACPMHPDVVSDKPGKCPKCGMNLALRAKKP
jgi:hypothetical protein